MDRNGVAEWSELAQLLVDGAGGVLEFRAVTGSGLSMYVNDNDFYDSGRLEITGRLTDRPGDGNRLGFEIDGLDPSYELSPHWLPGSSIVWWRGSWLGTNVPQVSVGFL